MSENQAAENGIKLPMVAFALLLLGSGCTSSAAPTQTPTLAQGEAIAMVKQAIPDSSLCVDFEKGLGTVKSAWTESYDKEKWIVSIEIGRSDYHPSPVWYVFKVYGQSKIVEQTAGLWHCLLSRAKGYPPPPAATFLILGNTCTRACLNCDVTSGRPTRGWSLEAKVLCHGEVYVPLPPGPGVSLSVN